jgi:hypothetical protein
MQRLRLQPDRKHERRLPGMRAFYSRVKGSEEIHPYRDPDISRSAEASKVLCFATDSADELNPLLAWPARICTASETIPGVI